MRVQWCSKAAAIGACFGKYMHREGDDDWRPPNYRQIIMLYITLCSILSHHFYIVGIEANLSTAISTSSRQRTQTTQIPHQRTRRPENHFSALKWLHATRMRVSRFWFDAMRRHIHYSARSKTAATTAAAAAVAACLSAFGRVREFATRSVLRAGGPSDTRAWCHVMCLCCVFECERLRCGVIHTSLWVSSVRSGFMWRMLLQRIMLVA